MLASCRSATKNIAVGLLNRAMVAISLEMDGRARTPPRGRAINGEISSRAVGRALEASAGSPCCAEWPRAARLFGAAERNRHSPGFAAIPPTGRSSPRVASAPEENSAAFAAAEAEGRALDYDAAITETRAAQGFPASYGSWCRAVHHRRIGIARLCRSQGGSWRRCSCRCSRPSSRPSCSCCRRGSRELVVLGRTRSRSRPNFTAAMAT